MALDFWPDTFDAELDAFFGQHVAAGQSRGLVYGRTTADGLVHTAGFGVADDDGHRPDADTIFPVASITKSFVGCAAMIAHERGLLSLHDPITDHVPEFTASGTAEDPVAPPTIGMLLSMSGGLTEDNSYIDPFIDQSEAEFLRQVAGGLRYSHLPGTVYEYSNIGFTLAGLAVGRAAGQPVEQFVRDEILEPLGLTSTHFDNAAPDGLRRATGYRRDESGAWRPYPPAASAAYTGAAGLMSSVTDLATWITWLGSALRPPVDGDVAILSRAGRRELQRLHIPATPAVAVAATGGLQPLLGGYGLGLAISFDLQRGTLVGHSGGLPGFLLHMVWHPDSGTGVVCLTNSEKGSPITLTSQALGRILAKENTAASTIRLWPETVELQGAAEQLVRGWDDTLAARILAPNVDFDRPLPVRRKEIAELIDQIGPLAPQRPGIEIVSAHSAADLTWAIPGEHGELICMIHLTPTSPARIQELVVRAVPTGTPRSAAPVDISGRRSALGAAFLSASANTRVVLPG